MNREALVRKHIKELMEERKMSQREFLKKCAEQKIAISQSGLSKIISGVHTLTVEHLDIFSKVLQVPISRFFEEENEDSILLNQDTQEFVVNANSSFFKGYLGEYHVYFFSTSQTEKGKILEGKLILSDQKNICRADMKIMLGGIGRTEDEADGEFKLYQGQMIISKGMASAHIIVLNQEMGDLGMITFRHRNFRLGQLEVRLGFALTSSAGDFNFPTVHYLLISRDSFATDFLEMLANTYMRFGNNFYIKNSDLENLIDRFPEAKDLFEKWKQIGIDYCSLDRHQLDSLLDQYCADEEKRLRLLSDIASYACQGDYGEAISPEREMELYRKFQAWSKP